METWEGWKGGSLQSSQSGKVRWTEVTYGADTTPAQGKASQPSGNRLASVSPALSVPCKACPCQNHERPPGVPDSQVLLQPCNCPALGSSWNLFEESPRSHWLLNPYGELSVSSLNPQQCCKTGLSPIF